MGSLTSEQTCPECSGTREAPFGTDTNDNKCTNNFHILTPVPSKSEELTDEQKVAMHRLYDNLVSIWVILDHEKHTIFENVDSMRKQVGDVLNSTYKSYRQQLEINRKGEQRRINEAMVDELSRLIPNFDGVGTIGYQYDDGSRVALDVRIDQLGDQIEKEELR